MTGSGLAEERGGQAAFHQEPKILFISVVISTSELITAFCTSDLSWRTWLIIIRIPPDSP